MAPALELSRKSFAKVAGPARESKKGKLLLFERKLYEGQDGSAALHRGDSCKPGMGQDDQQLHIACQSSQYRVTVSVYTCLVPLVTLEHVSECSKFNAPLRLTRALQLHYNCLMNVL